MLLLHLGLRTTLNSSTRRVHIHPTLQRHPSPSTTPQCIQYLATLLAAKYAQQHMQQATSRPCNKGSRTLKP
jgi:hypothetical protein